VSEVLPRSYAAPEPRRRARDVFRTYLALTKPRVIELLLITTVPAMILAQQGMPSIGLIVAGPGTARSPPGPWSPPPRWSSGSS